MIAIRLCEANINTILATDSITREKLLVKVERFGPDSVYGRALGRKYYFIPSGFLSYAIDSPTCMAEDSFALHFDADMTKIDTEFVEITRK